MVPPPLSRNDAHLVGSKPFDSDYFFVFGQEIGFHWRVGHEDVNEDRDNYCEKSAEEEYDLIGIEAVRLDVAKPIR